MMMVMMMMTMTTTMMVTRMKMMICYCRGAASLGQAPELLRRHRRGPHRKHNQMDQAGEQFPEPARRDQERRSQDPAAEMQEDFLNEDDAQMTRLPSIVLCRILSQARLLEVFQHSFMKATPRGLYSRFWAPKKFINPSLRRSS